MRNIIVNAAAGFAIVALVAAAASSGVAHEAAGAPYLTVILPN
jgi:hypothetical protein